MPTLVNDDGWASLSGRDKCLKHVVRSIRRLVQEAPEKAFAFFGLVCGVFEKVRPRTAAADETAEVSEAVKVTVPGKGNGPPKTSGDGSDQGGNISERDIADELRGSSPRRRSTAGRAGAPNGEAAGAADNTPTHGAPPAVVPAASKPVPSIEECVQFTADLERYVMIWHAPKPALARLVGRQLFKEQHGTKRKADHSLPLGPDLPGPKRPKASHLSSHLSATTGAKVQAEMATKKKVALAKAARDKAEAVREQAAADLKKAAAAAKKERANAARAAKEEPAARRPPRRRRRRMRPRPKRQRPKRPKHQRHGQRKPGPNRPGRRPRPKASHHSSHLSAATGAKAKAEMAAKEKGALVKSARDKAKETREPAAADLTKAAAAAKEKAADAARAAEEERRHEETAKTKAMAEKAAMAKEAMAKEAKAKEVKVKEAKAKEVKAKEAKAKEAHVQAGQAKAASAMTNASPVRTGQDAGRKPPVPKLAQPRPAQPGRTATDGGKKTVDEAANEKETAAQAAKAKAARDAVEAKAAADRAAVEKAAADKAAAAAAKKEATDKAANAQGVNDQAASTGPGPARHDHDGRGPPAAPSTSINVESSPAVSTKREIKLKES
ncbi:MAG: hypothetical protein M1826_004451 [Phylliscum demangeonii]|nr:MAG: hypothetical protein M1826_004451 [Phylliscum demangeonii]